MRVKPGTVDICDVNVHALEWCRQNHGQFIGHTYHSMEKQCNGICICCEPTVEEPTHQTYEISEADLAMMCGSCHPFSSLNKRGVQIPEKAKDYNVTMGDIDSICQVAYTQQPGMIATEQVMGFNRVMQLDIDPTDPELKYIDKFCNKIQAAEDLKNPGKMKYTGCCAKVTCASKVEKYTRMRYFHDACIR